LVKPRICASIIADEPIIAVEIVKELRPYQPDLIELRLDYMRSLNELHIVRKTTNIQLIATNRRKDQGGHCSSSESDRVATLLHACDAGFDYIDIELTTESIKDVIEDVKSRGIALIVSYHDLRGTPNKESLEKIMRNEIELGADICKVIGTSRSPLDNLIYLDLLAHTNENLVCFGMGKMGMMSRVFSPLFGGAFTYASAKSGRASTPGQLTIAELREIYRILGV
jgi:3-dehydroquinate dehydratase type I